MTGLESADIDRMLNSAGAAAANDPAADETRKQRAPPDSEPAGDSGSASDSSSGASDDAAKRKKRRRETSEQRVERETRERSHRSRRRRSRSRSRSRDRHRSRSRRDRDRRDRDRRDRDRDRRERDRRDRGDKRPRDRDRDRDRSSRREVDAEPPINQSTQVRGGGGRLRQTESMLLGPEEIMKREQEQIDRDQRTVFASQIHPKVTLREIFDFFSQVGKVRDVQCIQDQRTRKFKGLAYVEMDKVESVPLALALNGHNLKGYPVSVQLTQAEKNRAAQQAAMAARALNEQPMRVRVESLPLEMTEDDIRSLFVPFGRIDGVELEKDGAGKSLGMAWVGFRRAAEAQIAVNELNSMQLLGKQIAVTLEMPLVMQQLQAVAMQCTTASSTGGFSGQLGELDDDSGGGLHMSAQSRMALMQRLQRTESAAPAAPAPAAPQRALPDVRRIQETSCIVLKNLFTREEVQNDPDLPIDVKEDVEGEAAKHGELLHISVDAQSDGHVFLRYANVADARSAFASFDGRWFASKQISAEYVVEPSYELRFPGSGERSSRQ